MERPFSSVVCLGLDGATFDVIDPMIASGRLPTLAKLISGGSRAPLASVVPPLSAPAWVSFMTGLNPGKHGVFHFREIESGAGARLVSSSAYRGRTIFDHASKAGLKVVAFRVPLTYPAWKVNGVMVSGFPTPDPRTTYSEPPEAGRDIGPLFKLSPAGSIVAGIEGQIDNFSFHLERSTQALTELISEAGAQLFCSVNSVTDWAAHKFWRHSDPGAPAYEPFSMEKGTLLESFYEKSDSSLGKILDAAPGDPLVIVLSDHGTGPRSALRFDTSAWLKRRGLLSSPPRSLVPGAMSSLFGWLKDVAPKKYWLWRHSPAVVRKMAGLAGGEAGRVEWEATKAYRVPLDHHVEGINVNLAGRDPLGTVPQKEYEALRDDLIASAIALTDPDTGRKPMSGAFRREELYRGEHAELAPDVVLVLDTAYEFGPSPGKKPFGKVDAGRLKRSSASHRPDGILVMAGPGVRQNLGLTDAQLIDVPATIMWALGLPVPEEMDGRVLTEAFHEEVFDAHPVERTSAPPSAATSRREGYSEEEEQRLAEHLEELGYL